MTAVTPASGHGTTRRRPEEPSGKSRGSSTVSGRFVGETSVPGACPDAAAGTARARQARSSTPAPGTRLRRPPPEPLRRTRPRVIASGFGVDCIMPRPSSPRVPGPMDLLYFLREGPDDEVLVHGQDRAWTRRALRGRVSSEAEKWKERGAEAGAVLPVVADSTVEDVVRILAAWSLGAIPAPLNARLTPRERASAEAVLSRGGASEPLTSGAAAVLWTSGTSGRPRGVVLSAHALRSNADASRRRLGLVENDCWLASLSTAHVGGLALVVRALLLGSRLAAPGRLSHEDMLPWLTGDRGAPPVTHVSLVPTQLLRLLEAWGSGPPPDTLRCVLVGGAHAPRALVEEATARGWPVALTYGMTEMTSQVATAPPAEVRGDPTSVGRPLHGTELRITSDGEILVRGPTRALGYLGSADPITDDEGWYHTGDLGSVDARGHVRITGRRSDRIVSGGVTVDAVEVESVLGGHPAIREACVVGLPDAEWGERVAAAVVWETAEPGPRPEPDALRAWCRERLSAAKVPRRWVVLDALPRNANGKVDRTGVRSALT